MLQPQVELRRAKAKGTWCRTQGLVGTQGVSMTSGCQATGDREVRFHAMSLAVGHGKLFHVVYFVCFMLTAGVNYAE